MKTFYEIFANPKIAFIVYAIWVLVFVVILMRMGAFSGKFLQFGPSSDPETQTYFMGSPIDTWGKVFSLYALGFVSVCFGSYYQNIVGNWLTNSVRDHKHRTMLETKNWAYAMAYTDPVLGWINGFLGFFVSLTLQLQFIIPQMLGEILVTIIATNNFLSLKDGFKDTCQHTYELQRPAHSPLRKYNTP